MKDFIGAIDKSFIASRVKNFELKIQSGFLIKKISNHLVKVLDTSELAKNALDNIAMSRMPTNINNRVVKLIFDYLDNAAMRLEFDEQVKYLLGHEDLIAGGLKNVSNEILAEFTSRNQHVFRYGSKDRINLQ
jgi:hypothetical protein